MVRPGREAVGLWRPDVPGLPDFIRVARCPVRGTINGFPFRSSAFPTGDGTHQISVNKSMREGAKAGPGDTVRLVLEVDTSTRTARVPEDLRKALAASPTVGTNFEKLAWSHRKAYGNWIAEAKKPETRARRIAQAIERSSQDKGAFY